jgi:dihydroxy-acid dehydratase
VPHLCNLLPGGQYPLTEFYHEGGVPALLKELTPLLDLDVNTVSCSKLGDTIETYLCKRLNVENRRVIRPLDNPLHAGGGLAVLYGNLAPEGAVIKTGALQDFPDKMQGPAVPFDTMEDAVRAAMAGELKQNDIVVVRYEGPAGGPGMREMHMLSSLLSGMNSGAAVVTDGRFSGSSRGMCVGHVSPEASAGGLLALVEKGDLIKIDIPARRIDLMVKKQVLAGRKPTPAVKNIAPGLLARYQQLAGSAAQGAVLKKYHAAE